MFGSIRRRPTLTSRDEMSPLTCLIPDTSHVGFGVVPVVVSKHRTPSAVRDQLNEDISICDANAQLQLTRFPRARLEETHFRLRKDYANGTHSFHDERAWNEGARLPSS